jgi:hypothetical protein
LSDLLQLEVYRLLLRIVKIVKFRDTNNLHLP